MDYNLVKWLHVISATLLFGTGLGTAYYLLCAHLSRDVHAIAAVSRWVVVADWMFTAPAVILQPLSGVYLAHAAGYSFTGPWLLWSIALYILTGLCWLPVVWLQIRMRDLAGLAVAAHQPLPAVYWRYARAWLWLGIPAFVAVLMIFYLMVAKPA
ncbi:MAG: DUF2269 family protein [Gammaproteobacteria bacterium]